MLLVHEWQIMKVFKPLVLFKPHNEWISAGGWLNIPLLVSMSEKIQSGFIVCVSVRWHFQFHVGLSHNALHCFSSGTRLLLQTKATVGLFPQKRSLALGPVENGSVFLGSTREVWKDFIDWSVRDGLVHTITVFGCKRFNRQRKKGFTTNMMKQGPLYNAWKPNQSGMSTETTSSTSFVCACVYLRALKCMHSTVSGPSGKKEKLFIFHFVTQFSTLFWKRIPT